MFLNQKIQYCWDVSSPQIDQWSNATPIKIQADFLGVEITKLIFYLYKKYKGPTIAQIILKKGKKNRVGGFTRPNFKAFYKTTEIETVTSACRWPYRYIEQNRI